MVNDPGTASTLTISTKGNGKTGSWNLTVTGTSGTVKRTGTAALIVTT
jgi:hypothetical protein